MHGVCQQIVPRMLDEDQFANEVKSASQAELKDMTKNGFQKCFDDLYMPREAGWSNRRIGRHLGRSDMVVARCWQQWITEGSVDWIFADLGQWSSSSSVIRFSLSADVWRRTGQRSDPAFIVERHTAKRCDSVGSNFLGHTIIFSGPSRHFDSSQIRGHILTPICYPCYQVTQVPFINRIMLVHILRDSPNNVFKDMTSSWPARVTRSFANRACLDAGKATAAVPRKN
ncbi:hypothetical protein TNCV_236641 [Trichonephila clavipes]|nr:hypothetical protein TNCV_236641 [Trichonephila clavipes]